ncbi:MAG: DUF262 domain-containing protein [Syntrophales bacterium]|jgi:uncharacterized protein with ParB-like and HNH nuclease domain|nr:DUF262 domain-containing protein [Syntrophales bacterium]
MQIYQILDKIDEYQLFVPAFQREYVWKKSDAKELISSLVKEYPTGTMLTWETNNPPELKSKKEYDERQGAIKLILDGQQRITTLYMLIRGEIPHYYTKDDIKHDPRDLYINVETLELEYFKRTKMANNPLWVHLTDIFKKKIRAKDIVRELEKTEEVSRERDDLIDDNFKAIEKIPDREFIEQSIPIKATLKEAIDIFYIVNASGVNLTDAELALAQISGYWPKVREKFKNKLREMERDGFVFNLDFFVYVMMGVLHNGGSELQKLHNSDNLERMKAAWDLLEKHTLDYVTNLLKSQMYVDHTKEINSVYALVPIIIYVFNNGKENLSQAEINKIKKWFYYSQIRQRYISQMPQKLDKDVGIAVKSATPFDDLLNIIKLERPLEISKDEFIGVDIRNPLYSLMRWYFKSKNAICLSTGVSIRKNMGKNYSLEWDHIFPYSVLKKNGYDLNNRFKYSLAQEITNRAILTQTANRTKSNLLAEDYLKEVKTKFPNALKLQCIPENQELWQLEKFELFLENRRAILSKELNIFLDSITDTIDTEVETTIEDIISKGEGIGVEFKSSLRWDYEHSNINKRLEQAILKTITAISNSEGGTLLIGVNDDGEIIGLERDFSSLKGNRDEFELHLRNLINNNFGKVFASSNLEISFPVSGENEICQVEIKRSVKPVYLSIVNENGMKHEKFYIRSGNTSQELSISETAQYIATHFNGV